MSQEFLKPLELLFLKTQFSGYGALGASTTASFSAMASRYLPSAAATHPNIAQSNIWGVPELSVLLNQDQHDGMDSMSQSRLFSDLSDGGTAWTGGGQEGAGGSQRRAR